MKQLLFISYFCILSALGFGQDSISTTTWQQLVPSTNLPKALKIRHSNNNIDACTYKGRYYVAFRTAPTHFASKKTRIYIISTTDFKDWRVENQFWLGYDMREPRFVQLNDQLLFYFFEGGKKKFKFQPRFIWTCSTTGDGKWSEKQNINLNGYVPWRIKLHQNTLYLSAYYGVNLYKNSHKADLRLFTSVNGVDFQPISKEPQVTTKGAEEGEFEFDAQGNLWATIRLEGSGSFVAFAHKDSLHRWQTWFDKRKYDSALMFRRADNFYVVARRHLRDGGNATPIENPSRRQRRRNLVRYSFSRKRTALYQLDKQNHQLIHLQDFPSHGDNAFPAIAPIDNNSYYLFNYSNNIKRGDKKWIWGQLGKTNIYWTILTFK